MMQQYLNDTAAFEPETLAVMGEAFTQVCNTLNIFAGDDHGREVIAVRIIELARHGLTDANALADRITRESRAAA